MTRCARSGNAWERAKLQGQSECRIAEQPLPSAHKFLGSIMRTTGALFRSIRLCLCISRPHIDANQQSNAVRELIRACKLGGRIVILYSNPKSPIRFAAGAVHRLRKMIVRKKRFRRPDYISLRTRSAGGSSSKMTATSP
jgi:hypothetical protein